MGKAKTKAKQQVENPIEKLFGVNFGSNLDEFLGLKSSEGKKSHSGDLFEGEELDLKKFQQSNKKEETSKSVEPGINYSREIVQAEEITIRRENRETEIQLREIMVEIKKLADSSKALQMQFKEIAVEQHVAKPGKYHKTFFAWLFSIVRAARMKVEDSNAWLTVLQSKKKSREYGAMAKKHGTSFSLSNERNVATSVG
jgi:hypothetical protein